MTFREAMRQPMTLQGMIMLLLGYFVGIAFSICFLVVAGPAIRDIVRAQDPPAPVECGPTR